jgi:haloalkane dehalogenase
MVPFHRYRIEAGGYRHSVMEVGEGRPVLCVHGNPAWGFLYRKVAMALTDHPVRVIMPDLVGLGFSDRPDLPHTLENHIRWLGSLIDALELDDLIMVVQDWGGAIGVGAMIKRPDRLTGLVVLNTALSEPRPDFKATTFHRFGQLPVISDFTYRVLGFPQIALGFAQGDRGSINGKVRRAYRYPLRNRLQNQAPLALTRMVPDSMDHPSVPTLRRVGEFVRTYRGPAEIVWGDRDPVLGRVRNHISRMIPHAPVTRTQAGHFLQEEVPHEIAAAVVRVVERS